MATFALFVTLADYTLRACAVACLVLFALNTD